MIFNGMLQAVKSSTLSIISHKKSLKKNVTQFHHSFLQPKAKLVIFHPLTYLVFSSNRSLYVTFNLLNVKCWKSQQNDSTPVLLLPCDFILINKMEFSIQDFYSLFSNTLLFLFSLLTFVMKNNV